MTTPIDQRRLRSPDNSPSPRSRSQASTVSNAGPLSSGPVAMRLGLVDGGPIGGATRRIAMPRHSAELVPPQRRSTATITASSAPSGPVLIAQEHEGPSAVRPATREWLSSVSARSLASHGSR
jgi:hypothetical protein